MVQLSEDHVDRDMNFTVTGEPENTVKITVSSIFSSQTTLILSHTKGKIKSSFPYTVKYIYIYTC